MDAGEPAVVAAPPKGTKRFFKLAGLTAGTASRFAGNAIANLGRSAEKRAEKQGDLYAKLGGNVAQTLGELKGAAMKLGQIASQASEFLPDEISTALATLQNEAPPMPYAMIRDQVLAELGDEPDQLFADFETASYASASIGQVHRATTHDGRAVVVKVQYPGVDESVDSDLKQLKLTLKAARLVKVKGKVIDEMFAEVRERLLEELDYSNELANLLLLAEFHADDDDVIIPTALPEFCSRRVLTLEYIQGDHIDVVRDSADYNQEQRNAFAHSLFRIISDQLFKARAVHADPHPGNFAFRPNGKIIFYDFGCVKRIPLPIAQAYQDTIRAALNDDYAALDDALIRLGIRLKDGPAVEDRFYNFWRNLFLRPMLADEPFDFKASTMHEETMRYTGKVLKRMDSFQPAADTLFVDRVVGGHYWTLMKLKACVNLRSDLQRVLGIDVS